MYPIALNLTRIPILLIGQGELVVRRLQQLTDAGATKVEVCHSREGGNPDFLKELDSRLRGNDYKIIMVAGLPREQAEAIATAARAAGKLVNVEDINDLCDFYFTANVMRGDLVIAVSTSGASPTLARKIRDRIAALFGEEWSARVHEISEYRLRLKSEGADMKTTIAATEDFLQKKGWMP